MKTVIKCTDGSVAIMTLVPGANLNECLRKWQDVNPGKYLSHRDMPEDAIPKDREFRDAWTDDTPAPIIHIDMQKARAIYLNRIRIRRNAELDRLDKEQTKAQDQDRHADAEAIKAQKQALRDLPQTIAAELEAAQTVEEMKAIKIPV